MRSLLGRTRPLCWAALTSAGKYAAGKGRWRGVLGTDPFSPPLGPGGKGEGLGDVVRRQEQP